MGDLEGNEAWTVATLSATPADLDRPVEPIRVYLLVFQGDSSRMVPLPSDGDVVLGRDPAAEVVIADASVSRRHAQLVLVDGLATVCDLGSQNGTRLNGEPVTAARPMVSGDVLTVGAVTISFQTSSRVQAGRELLALQDFQQRAATEIDRAVRFQRPLALLAIELGTGGATDRIAIRRALATRLRAVDIAAWSGSDQLLVLLTEADGDGARIAADGVAASLRPVSSPRIGIAQWPDDGDDIDTLIGSARSAASLAPAGGRAQADRARSTRTIGARTIVVADAMMARVYALVERLANTDLAVLIFGETGTGKEVAARALHEWSSRAGKPQVSLNCAALTETLVEAELFGHERGAFSGAITARPGLLEAAAGGTVFLDEVGELPLGIQAKLLRVLESKRVTRVGDVREREVEFRIVAATNRDLEQAVAAGTFRRDLYFRLAAATLWLPPLRDRKRELPLLAQSFLVEACARLGRPPLTLSSGALHVLASHTWPGNVRELKNVMDYVAATTLDAVVAADHVTPRLQPGLGRPAPAPAPAPVAEPAPPIEPAPAPAASTGPIKFRPLDEEIRELERTRIEQALAACNHNQTRAAEAISMPLRTFVNKVRQYGLSPRAARK